MRFSVKNQTGETWPAYGMARLGEVLSYDGPNADVPLYDLIKPDGEDGIYVVNGAASLEDGSEGTSVHYTVSQYAFVDTEDVEVGTIIGAESDQWNAIPDGTTQLFRCLNTRNETTGVVPVIPHAAGGTAGTPSILFEIVRVLRGFGLNCNAMECEVINITCGGGGVSIGDIVIVYDEIGCIFNAPEHLLNGLRGYAIKMGNPSYASDDPLIFEPGTEDIAKPTGNCRWCAQSTCCVEEE